MKLGYKIPDILGSNRYKIRFNLTSLKKDVPVLPQKKLQAFQAQRRGHGGHQRDHFHVGSPTDLPLTDAPKSIAIIKFVQKNFEIFYRFLGKFLRGIWVTT